MPFRLVEHTADLGIEATGQSREEALAAAADGLTAVLTGRTGTVHGMPERELTFSVEAPDADALVVAFLSELLWSFESEDLLWMGGGVSLGASRDGILRLEARGNVTRYDPSRHGRGVEVKAVTYHDVALRRDGSGWLLRALLDI
ncbi:MAG: archease [bacterium]